jgi:deoxyribonuclease IV
MLFGAHVSVAGGYLKALEYAESIGAECAQIFAKSPRQWKGPAVDPAAAEQFIAQRARLNFGPVFTHSAYLVNLATDDPELRAKSIPALADELVRGATLGAAGTVCHVGNDPAADPVAAALRVAEAVAEAFELAGSAADSARLLLENTAGAGRTFGSTFEELGACISATGLPPERLGVCLDTCHAFAFGMPVDTSEGWREVIADIDSHCGLDRLGLVHANDCLFARGTRRDRHAWVGDGFIGDTGFQAMVCSPELAGTAACVEMSGDVPIKDTTNIDRLKNMRNQCA